LNSSTWNHAVATFVKGAPELHHYSQHNSPKLGGGLPSNRRMTTSGR